MKKSLLCIVWLICVTKEIYEFMICEKSVYSYFLLVTLLTSGMMIIIYLLRTNGRKSEKWLLITGITIFAVRELVIIIKLTLWYIEMFPQYTNPFGAAIKLYVGVFVSLALGYVTWLQKDA